MNRTSRLITAISASVLLLVISVAVMLTANAQPGDADDPLVTKSYIDSIVSSLAAENASLKEAINNLPSKEQGTSSEDPVASQFDSEAFASQIEQMVSDAVAGIQNGYKTVEIALGQTVDLSEGAELIIRTGMCEAVASSSSAGLFDLSDGSVVMGGKTVPAGHYIVAARGERGIKALSDSVVLIRGDYVIE